MYSKDRSTIVDRREMLRVKLKSLAEEARIIRREENRSILVTYGRDEAGKRVVLKRLKNGALRHELRAHRTGVVRDAARAAHLAYGFIKGRTLEQMEPRRHPDVPSWQIEAADRVLMGEVRKLIRKYGPADFVEPACMSAKQEPKIDVYRGTTQAVSGTVTTVEA